MSIDHLIVTDVETGGLDPATSPTIEVAAAIFDVRLGCVVEAFSSLLRADSNAASEINRIDPAALVNAPHPDYVWGRITSMVATTTSAAFLAHRASFDRSFYPPAIAAKLPWICSKTECEWPKSKLGASLVEVALAHDVPVHANHRALTDVMLLCKILERCKDTLPSILARAMRPSALYVALVSYDDREKAKAAGFTWNGADKTWTRRLAKDDASSIGFPVREVSP